MHEFLPQVSQLHHDRLAFRSCVSCRISMQFDNVSMMGFLSYLEYSFELKFLHLKAISCGQNMLEKAVYFVRYLMLISIEIKPIKFLPLLFLNLKTKHKLFVSVSSILLWRIMQWSIPEIQICASFISLYVYRIPTTEDFNFCWLLTFDT